MKKLILLSAGLTAVLLTGCSFDKENPTFKLDEVTAQAEDFADKAEEFGDKVAGAKTELGKLADQRKLDDKDQENIVDQIAVMLEAFDEFKQEDAPFLTKTAKKIVIEEMNKVKVDLKKIQNKAEKGKATKADLEKIDELLSGKEIDIL